MKQTDFIFGIRAVIETIQAGKEVNKILIQKGLKSPLFEELHQLVKERKFITQYVPTEKLNRITRKNHQGVICFVSPVEYHKTENLIPWLYDQGKVPALLILDRVTDVRNFGAIARSAECMGLDALIIPSRNSALINGDVMKTSAGALNHIPVCKEDNLKKTIAYLKNCGLSIIGCTEKTKNPIHEVDFTGPTAIIMGSEENGISPEYLNLCDGRCQIPMTGNVASMNVAVCSSIAIYELNKQRNNA